MEPSTTVALASPELQARWASLPCPERERLADAAGRLMLERSLFNMVTPIVVIAAYLALRPGDAVLLSVGLGAIAGMVVIALFRHLTRRLARRHRRFAITELLVNALWSTVVCVALARQGLRVTEAMLLLITAGLGSAMMYGLQPDLRLRQAMVVLDGVAVMATLAALGSTESLTFAGLGVGLLTLQLVQSQRLYAQYWTGQLDEAERCLGTLALRQSQAELRRVIDAAPVGMMALRAQRVVLANPELLRLLGATADDVLGRDIGAVAPALASAVGPATGELRLASGATVEVPPPTEIVLDGAPARLIVARDISARRELEARLAMTDRAVALATMAAGFAHELNNPLAVVEGTWDLALEALRRTPPGIVEARQLLAEAGASQARLRAIVGDLGALARAEETPSLVEVRALVASAVRLVQNQLRHRAAVEVDLDDVPHVLAVPGQLVQVILALLTNAAQAIPLGRAADHTVRLVLRADTAGRVVLEVRDDGEGIPATVLPRVFEPFFTTRGHDGTGLGLTICHAIVRRFGGELVITSRAGVGTTARLSLPAVTAGPVGAASPPPPAPVVVGTRRVLVVDDEPLIGSLVRRMLEGDEVVVVESAAAALAHLSRHAVDAVLCDLMMPNITGIELHAHLEIAQPAVARRMLFMSGGVFGEAARQFVDQIGPRVLAKPFGRRQLEAAVRAVVDAEARP